MARLLIVDDYVDAAASLAAFLRCKGHEVEAVNNPLEALEKTQAAAYDLVISDYNMPQMNGVELVRRLGENARVLLWSANSEHRIAAEEQDYGAMRQAGKIVGFYRKGDNPAELNEILESALARPKLPPGAIGSGRGGMAYDR